MAAVLPSGAVIRVSRGNFDPKRYPEVERMSRETGKYLIPAIRRLSGLISYFAAVSPSGSMVHVSNWDSEEHAQQMSNVKEMIVDARRDAEAVDVRFIPIINYPLSWTI